MVSCRQMGHRVVGLSLLVVLAVSGCGKKGPPPAPEGVAVSGKVLLPNNAPVPGGTLILRPVSGLHGATGTIQADGSFTLTDSAGRNVVVPGKYQVFIKLPANADDNVQKMINARYLDTETGDSDIVVEIKGPVSDLSIKLKS
jgi:hypothetical protein